MQYSSTVSYNCLLLLIGIQSYNIIPLFTRKYINGEIYFQVFWILVQYEKIWRNQKKINHIPRERKRKRSRGCVFSISCCFLCVRTKLIRHLVPVFLFTSTSIGDGSSGYVWGRIYCIDVVDMPMTWNNTKVSQSIVIGSDVRPIQIRWLLVARFWKSTFLNLTAFWHHFDVSRIISSSRNFE